MVCFHKRGRLLSFTLVSVVVEVHVPSEAFRLGRVLDIPGGTSVKFEQVVPADEEAFPTFWAYGAAHDRLDEHLEIEPGIASISRRDLHPEGTLYDVAWEDPFGDFMERIAAQEVEVLEATGAPDRWELQLRFRDRDHVTAFQSFCTERSIPINIRRVATPEIPDASPSFGMTFPQRVALATAVELGYYDIPRQCTTADLGAELGISDQAASERLRRGIKRLVTNTIVPSNSGSNHP